MITAKAQGVSCSVQTMCEQHSISRQAYYKQCQRQARRHIQDEHVLDLVRTIRHRQPMVGTRKLHRMLSARPALGRDRLFALLRTAGLLVQRKRRYARTTNSAHRFHTYTNLIKDLELTRPEQVFVADITYLATRTGFSYLALLTDAFSRKIVGYDLSTSLSIEGSLRALRMALKDVKHPEELMHHSDRGLQYCSHAYVRCLQLHKASISMAAKGDVYENALAERVNGILKTEFLLDREFPSHQEALAAVNQAVEIYNKERLHMAINYLTPELKHAA
jgi:transposase InsO family protein